MESASTIVVLEDDSRRSNEMRRVVRETLPAFDAIFFDNSRELRAWLRHGIARACVVSLDCDLDTTTVRDGADAGSGSEIADYLATLPASCPIIIHSSNAIRAPAMHMTLTFAGWGDVRLSPYTDAEAWLRDLLNAVGETPR